MAPLGLRDRQAGTVTVTTSQAMWKKLDRIRRNSGVAVAYHARELAVRRRPSRRARVLPPGLPSSNVITEGKSEHQNGEPRSPLSEQVRAGIR